MSRKTSSHDEGQHLFDTSNGATEAFRAKVEALGRPATYGEEVASVEAIETHMAWVFLTDFHAYKLKKPVRTQWFDHRSIEARRRACDTELRLNRRLSPDVYQDVVSLTSCRGELEVQGLGTVVDWMVKMRRLPREQMLDHCIERGAVTSTIVDALSRRLALFYDSTEHAPMSGAEYTARISDDIESKRASLARPRYGLDRRDVDAVTDAQRQWLGEFSRLLEDRAESVVDAHGDLRPEHICLERPPKIIDCLEFSRPLRLLDPLSELSFLAMECRRLGAAWIGERVLAGYGQQSGDRAPEELVAFYGSYHAIVRAAVAIWHIDDELLDESDTWRDKATHYLHIARRLLA